jgi:TolB-like protein/cytochrome c-type biogenesis protein CcmH/NrfG
MESGSTRAVFLSYAREDTAAALRIAEALRSHGVEAWFDQNELRGGDAWDQKIRRQIRECTLFMPVISVHTQARHEGYFRREWKQAVERTHDMAEGVPFVVPVVVDETVDAGAVVPGEFLRVQWTRLPGALPTQEFVEQVKALLEGPRKAKAPSGTPFAAAELKATGSHPPRGIPGWVWGAVAGIGAAAIVYILVSRKPEAPAASATVAAPIVTPAVTPQPAAPKIDEKSIAVLPFANMSEEKDNEFFAEGIQDDILTNLALLHELHVVSRTSVMQYRDTTKSIGQIASELGVAYILEGSVRREGNKVRVTGQLIHAATDEHVWAKAYDRDLTDIFSIQSELAQDIAGELNAAIAPEEKASLDRRPTENTEAYDLYLRARTKNDARVAEMDEKIALLQKAVALDPSFARAWGELARAYAYGAFHFQEGMDELADKAKAASDRSVQLAPDDPDVISKLGDYYYYAHRDYARANEEYQRLAQQRPNDAVVFSSLGLIQRRQGRWAESLANLRRATELDVANEAYLSNLISSLSAARRYDELAGAWRKMVALKPDDLEMGYQLALNSFLASGSTRDVEAFVANLTPEEANSPKGISIRADWAANVGNNAEFVRLMRIQPYLVDSPLSHSEQDVLQAGALFINGDHSGALARLGNMPTVIEDELKREPRNPRLWFLKGRIDLVLGRPADAVSSADRCEQLIPESVDALEGPLYASLCVFLYDQAGDKERALSEYSRLLRDPGSVLNLQEMKRDPYITLHGDPRFEALMNDPANNAPLF